MPGRAACWVSRRSTSRSPRSRCAIRAASSERRSAATRHAVRLGQEVQALPRAARVRPAPARARGGPDRAEARLPARGRRSSPNARPGGLNPKSLPRRPRRPARWSRACGRKPSGVDAFLHAYDLGSDEGIAMMCLAEALLRIPDAHTADELIAEQTCRPGLVGKARPVGLGLRQCRDLLAAPDRQGAGGRAGPFRQLESGAGPRRRPPRRAGGPDRGSRGDEDPRPQLRVRPDHRRGAEARAGPERRQGLSHSFDMLGEAARTFDDAERYADAYRGALDRIAGQAKGASANRPASRSS